MRTGMVMSLKIPAIPNGRDLVDVDLNVLMAPTDIAAHRTVAGWLLFDLPNSVVKEARIDSYTVLLQDTHQNTTRIEQDIIRELADENPQG